MTSTFDRDLRHGWRAMRRHFIAGLIVIAPIGVTALVLLWLFQWLDGLLGRFLYPVTGTIPGLGLLVLILVLIGAGWATEWALGKRVVAAWHTVLERIPVTRPLFNASNRIVKTVFGKDRRFFRDVVLIPYPSPGRWSIGFLTSAAPGAVRPHIENAVTVFVPTAPNPTSGFLIIVPREQAIPLSMTTEEAFTFMLSAGSVTPEREVTDEERITPLEARLGNPRA